MFLNRFKPTWIVLAALLLTLPTLGVRDIVTSHEGRVAQTARQMAASGWPWNATPVVVPSVGWREVEGVKRLLPDESLPPLSVNPWIVPVISGEIRLQKPPLPYWATAVMFKLFGVNEWAARVVPAILGALLALLVADLARLLVHPRMAVWAAAVWVSSYFCFDEFRKCMVDPYLAFFAIAAVWAGIRAMQHGMQKDELRMQNEEGAIASSFCILHSSFCILFYVFLALGFLAKGPAVFVPVIPGLIAAWSPRRLTLKRSALLTHGLGIALFLLIAIPWYAVILHRVPNALALWRYESLGGFGEKDEKPQAFWWYGPQLLLISLPWTPLWIVGIAVSAQQFRRRGAALLWQALIVLVFSLLTQKKNAYLLPALAAQTLLVTQGLRWLFLIARRFWPRAGVPRVVAMVAAGCALGIAILFPWMAKTYDNPRSARNVGQEITRRLPGSGATLDESSLPPDAAFYLPLASDSGGSPWVKWMLVDDRRNTAVATPDAVDQLFPGQTVTAVRRVQLDASAEKFRWKLLEVHLRRGEPIAFLQQINLSVL